jgi:hypothetical protein
MRRKILLIVSIALTLIQAGNLYSQCVPDAVNCRDTLLPGEICPTELPVAYLGLTYHQTVTILPPPTAIISEVGFTIFKIRIDTVSNLPPGISYEPNEEDMYPGTAYCVLISGIPSEAGEFTLNIGVTPFVMLMDSVIEAPLVVNDTSVTITVVEQNGMGSMQVDGFNFFIYGANPFSETTTLGFIMNESSPVKLNVYDCLGNLIYSETTKAKPGRNFFRFTGASISPGYYIYSVVNSKTVYSGKLIKSR